MKKKALWIHYATLWFFLLLAIGLTFEMGDSDWSLAFNTLWERFSGAENSWNPILDEKIPRLIVLLCSGSSLAVSGSITQSLFSNPLASPSVIGITFGGSLCVILTFIFGWQMAHPYTIPIAAFVGCMLTLLLVYGISRARGTIHMHSLILTGIAISTLLLAFQGTILYALRDQWHLIQTLTEWEAGSTLNKTWKHVHMQLPLTLIGLWGCWSYRKEIDILSLGEDEAMNLGVDVSRVRWRLFLCISLLTGGTIATVGVIGFFGLVLPNLLRSLYGPMSKDLIPLSILSGSMSLLALDSILRFFQIHLLSIGNLSAVLGGIFFLAILLKNPRHLSEESSC